MNPQTNHLAKNAQAVLKDHLREQEDRKRVILREQQMRELEQFEKKLFHKQEELKRVKAELTRLKAEAVVREKEFKNSVLNTRQKNHIAEIENKIKTVDGSVQHKLNAVTQKIQQNKTLFENKKKELLKYEEHAHSLQDHVTKNPAETMAKIQKLEHEVHDNQEVLTRKLNAVTQKIQQNKTLFENKKKELLKYEEQIRELEIKIHNLTRETNTLAQMQTSLSYEKEHLTTSLQKDTSIKTHELQTLKYKNTQEQAEFEAKQKELKITETKILALKKETDTLAQMQTSLSKEKEHLVSQNEQQKFKLNSDIQKTQSILQAAQQREESEKRIFKNTQQHITGLEQALKDFTQDISVLDNKIKALKTAMR